jgi:hypothetical protein
MKARVLTAILVLTLSTAALFANNANSTAMNKEVTSSLTISLMPSTPKEATFEDPTEATIPAVIELAPVNPAVADFNDGEITFNDLSDLAPVNPNEAGFSDSEITVADFRELAPVTPAFADFNDPE